MEHESCTYIANHYARLKDDNDRFSACHGFRGLKIRVFGVSDGSKEGWRP
jgi:hypothetical protein